MADSSASATQEGHSEIKRRSREIQKREYSEIRRQSREIQDTESSEIRRLSPVREGYRVH
jgi:hypothetical protein